ncbi:MAG: hypothetical protein HZB15_04030 [Actinobacteria bacterium]|nr:hypothetical protein [Actinomycetota bacterium]
MPDGSVTSQRRAVAALAVCLAALSGCATTYDSTLVADTAPATTTTVPTGAAADLLPRLEAEALGLSSVMIDGGDDEAVSEQIDSLWTAARAEVSSARPDLVDGFDQNVALVAKAVRFKRAADADKAANNLSLLIDAYLS